MSRKKSCCGGCAEEDRSKATLSLDESTELVEMASIPRNDGGIMEMNEWAADSDSRPQIGGSMADEIAMLDAAENLVKAVTPSQACSGTTPPDQKGFFGYDGVESTPTVLENVLESLHPLPSSNPYPNERFFD